MGVEIRKNLIILTLILVSIASAEIINIPDDYSAIQPGINASTDGDTILVQPGNYNGSIDFMGKAIILGSLYLTTEDSTYIETTIINGNSSYCVNFGNAENINSILTGFTLGNNENGVHCYSSSPKIAHNIIEAYGNFGLRCDSLANPLITYNIIKNSTRNIQITSHSNPNIRENTLILSNNISATGIFISQGDPVIDRNIIIGDSNINSNGIENWSYNSSFTISNNIISGINSGIELSGSSNVTCVNNLIRNCSQGIRCWSSDNLFINNTIVDNENAGIYSPYNQEIYNCIIWGNNPDISCDTYLPDNISISNCCIGTGIPLHCIDLGGNTNRSPCFLSDNDYRLSVFSPCIDTGIIDPAGQTLPDTDLKGNPRNQDGNGDSIDLPDMGCYESAEVTDPGFISGNVTLADGSGNIEDVCIAVGAPIHPDAAGNYQIFIDPSQSPYDIIAWLEGYLPQTIYEVPVSAGQETSGINFTLSTYQPEEYLETTPDSLFFPDYDNHYIIINNNSLINILINNLIFTQNHVFSNWTYTPYEITFPRYLPAGDSLELLISLDLPVDNLVREIIYDTLYVETNYGTYSVSLIWDTNLINPSEEVTTELCPHLTNYPNPFNPETTIYFSLPVKTKVNLSIYNTNGQRVRCLTNNQLLKGNHRTVWDGLDEFGHPVSSGIYYYQLCYDNKKITKKCILLK